MDRVTEPGLPPGLAHLCPPSSWERPSLLPGRRWYFCPGDSALIKPDPPGASCPVLSKPYCKGANGCCPTFQVAAPQLSLWKWGNNFSPILVLCGLARGWYVHLSTLGRRRGPHLSTGLQGASRERGQLSRSTPFLMTGAPADTQPFQNLCQ